jgi:hypothetical protein
MHVLNIPARFGKSLAWRMLLAKYDAAMPTEAQVPLECSITISLSIHPINFTSSQRDSFMDFICKVQHCSDNQSLTISWLFHTKIVLESHRLQISNDMNARAWLPNKACCTVDDHQRTKQCKPSKWIMKPWWSSHFLSLHCDFNLNLLLQKGRNMLIGYRQHSKTTQIQDCNAIPHYFWLTLIVCRAHGSLLGPTSYTFFARTAFRYSWWPWRKYMTSSPIWG